jgi:hypothetical protein
MNILNFTPNVKIEIHVKEKILSALKTKYNNLGFGEKAFGGVADFLATTITEESNIDNGIAGIEPLLKAFQSDIDKRVNDAVAKTKAEAPKQEAPKPNDTPPAPAGDEVPSWAKGILDRLDRYEKKEQHDNLVSKAKSKLAQNNVPESFLRGRQINLESEAEIDNLVAQISADYTVFRQDLVNSGVILSTPPDSGGQEKAEAAVAKMIAEKRNNPTMSQGVEGKKLI